MPYNDFDVAVAASLDQHKLEQAKALKAQTKEQDELKQAIQASLEQNELDKAVAASKEQYALEQLFIKQEAKHLLKAVELSKEQYVKDAEQRSIKQYMVDFLNNLNLSIAIQRSFDDLQLGVVGKVLAVATKAVMAPVQYIASPITTVLSANIQCFSVANKAVNYKVELDEQMPDLTKAAQNVVVGLKEMFAVDKAASNSR